LEPSESTTSDTFRKTAFIGGGQVGYNWQTGQTVVGVEADAAWSNLKNSHETLNDPFFFGKATLEVHVTDRLAGHLPWSCWYYRDPGSCFT
jgi:hypothetical protein